MGGSGGQGGHGSSGWSSARPLRGLGRRAAWCGRSAPDFAGIVRAASVGSPRLRRAVCWRAVGGCEAGLATRRAASVGERRCACPRFAITRAHGLAMGGEPPPDRSWRCQTSNRCGFGRQRRIRAAGGRGGCTQGAARREGGWRQNAGGAVFPVGCWRRPLRGEAGGGGRSERGREERMGGSDISATITSCGGQAGRAGTSSASECASARRRKSPGARAARKGESRRKRVREGEAAQEGEPGVHAVHALGLAPRLPILSFSSACHAGVPTSR